MTAHSAVFFSRGNNHQQPRWSPLSSTTSHQFFIVDVFFSTSVFYVCTCADVMYYLLLSNRHLNPLISTEDNWKTKREGLTHFVYIWPTPLAHFSMRNSTNLWRCKKRSTAIKLADDLCLQKFEHFLILGKNWLELHFGRKTPWEKSLAKNELFEQRPSMEKNKNNGGINIKVVLGQKKSIHLLFSSSASTAL